MKSNRTHTWQLFSHSGKNLPLILHGFLALSLYAQQLLAVRACLRATKALPALRWRTWCALRSRRVLDLLVETVAMMKPWQIWHSPTLHTLRLQIQDVKIILQTAWRFDKGMGSCTRECLTRILSQNCALWLDSSGVMNFLHHGNQVASCNRAQQDNEISKRNSIKSGVYYLSIHSVPLKKNAAGTLSRSINLKDPKEFNWIEME